MVTGISSQYDWQDMIYGNNNTIGCNMGVPRHLNRYTVLIKPPSDTDTRSPNLTQMIKIANINDTKGLPCINWKYDWKNGLLTNVLNPEITSHTQRQAMSTSLNDSAYLPIGVQTTGFGETNNYLGAQAVNIRSAHVANTIAAMPYNAPIEKAPCLVRQQGQPMTSDHCPLIHFGVMPVQSNPVNAPAATFAAVAAIWLVETEIDIESHTDYPFAGTLQPYLKSWDPWLSQRDFASTYFNTNYGGLFMCNRRTYGTQPYDSNYIV